MKNLIYILSIIIAAIGCASPQSEQKPEADKVLLISFDGFRYDYLDKTDTPNFDKLVEEGVISEGLIPVFPSKTFPNYYAIATGLYPENNGFVGNSMYDPDTDERFTIGNREAVENPEWYQGEPIWNTVEKAGKNAGTMFWVGSETPIQDMRPTFWKKYDESMDDSARIDTVVKWLSMDTPKQVDLATLYFHFVDSKGHRHGVNSSELIAAVRRADDLVGYLVERMNEAQLTDQTNMLIVSDHGMTDLSRDKIVVLDDMIDPADLDVISSSPALMANVKQGKLNEVYNALKQNEEHFKVYKKDDIPDRFHLKNHRRIPELLLIADMGYTINTKESFDRNKDYPSGATHGYDNREKEMHGIFIGNGPDLKSGYVMQEFENIHLYELMTYLLNIEPAETDGDIDSVSVMLN